MSELLLSRFTPRARQAVLLAQKQSDRMEHNFVGTEHLLLGLLKIGQGASVIVLQKHGINLDNASAAVEKEMPIGSKRVVGRTGEFTPRIKSVLLLARSGADLYGHTYVGTEHLLLAIVDDASGLAARVMVTLGCDLLKLKADILKEFESSPVLSVSSVSSAVFVRTACMIFELRPEDNLVAGLIESMQLSLLQQLIKTAGLIPIEGPIINSLKKAILFTEDFEFLKACLPLLGFDSAKGESKQNTEAISMISGIFDAVDHSEKAKGNLGTLLQLMTNAPVPVTIDYVGAWQKVKKPTPAVPPVAET